MSNNVPQDMFDGIIKIFHDAYIANEKSFNEMFQHTRVSLAKKIESLFPGGEPENERAMIEIETKKIKM